MKVVSVSVLFVISAVAGGVPPTEQPADLPKDGSWVRYHVVHYRADGAERTYKLTVAFVGPTGHEGEKCRWIELREKHEDFDQPQIHKVLIAEKQLRESDKPFDHVLKYQTQYEGVVEERGVQFGGVFGFYALFLPGVLKHTQKLDEPKLVEYQAGTLRIPDGLTGRYVWERRAKTAPVVYTYTWDYSIWMHADVSIGFAHAKMKLVRKEDDNDLGTDTFEFFLEETGDKAKSTF